MKSRSKTGAALFALIFALVFGAGGVFGVVNLVGQLREWQRAKTWHATSATVVEADLKTSRSDDTDTQKATARYSYVVDGHEYFGTRVGISTGSDNLGSWQYDRYMQLATAKHSGQPITIWFDPTNPQHSVVDRALRWSVIALMIPFATLFPMVSLAALWFLVRILRGNGTELSVPQPGENPAVIRSNAGSELRTLWLLATFWGLITFPISFIFIPQSFGHSWTWLLVAFFPLIGLGLIWLALSQSLRLLRNGEVTLAVQPSRPRPGQSLAVHAAFSKSPAPGEYSMSLLCEKVDTRSEDTSYATVWKQERIVQVHGPQAAASFSPPQELPGSEPITSIYHRWRVLLNFPGGKDQRSFDVLMQPGQTDSVASNVEPEPAPASGREESLTSQSQARNFRWIKRGLETVVLLVIASIGWKIVGGIFTDKTPATHDLQVEAPSASSTSRKIDRSLHDAIANHDAEGVKTALAAGANVDATNDWGGTSLIVAARFGDTGIVKQLLDAGANVNFHVIAKNEYNGRTALMNAAWRADAPTVALLLDAGADARAFESHGWSAAHYAARSGNITTLRVLHDRGVDLDLPSPENLGETPLMIAAHFGQVESINELIRLGANPRATDRYGENVYDWARRSRQSAAMQALNSYR